MAGFVPTLFERLRDEAPLHGGGGTATHKRWSVEELKESVARDLESLLNSRANIFVDEYEEYPESFNSVISYGMSDFVGMSLANPLDRDIICRTLERAIAFHEPRLRNVEVRLEPSRNAIGCLQFCINAVLFVAPAHEPVNFDALLQPNTLQYSVASNRRMVGVR